MWAAHDVSINWGSCSFPTFSHHNKCLMLNFESEMFWVPQNKIFFFSLLLVILAVDAPVNLLYKF